MAEQRDPADHLALCFIEEKNEAQGENDAKTTWQEASRHSQTSFVLQPRA